MDGGLSKVSFNLEYLAGKAAVFVIQALLLHFDKLAASAEFMKSADISNDPCVVKSHQGCVD